MSGGGGGIIILRYAMKQALTDPLVHGNLPASRRAAVDSILASDPNHWTDEEYHEVLRAFEWAARNC